MSKARDRYKTDENKAVAKEIGRQLRTVLAPVVEQSIPEQMQGLVLAFASNTSET